MRYIKLISLLIFLLSLIVMVFVIYNFKQLSNPIQVISQDEMMTRYSFSQNPPLVLPTPCKEEIPGLKFLNCP